MSNSLAIQKLVTQLNKAKNAYYNQSKPIMSDAAFDAAEDKLRKMDPRNAYFKKVGAPVKAVRGSRKQELPFNMGSMNKVRNFEEFGNNYPGPYVVEDKLDGVSLLYDNSTGTPQLFTRGNGTVGQNVSHLLPILKLPKLKKKQTVRCEAIISKAAFEQFADEFENPRNLVSGMANKTEVSPHWVAAHIIAFEQLSPRVKQSVALANLKKQGFRVPAFKIFKTLTTAQLTTLLATRKSKSPYHIDGLVIVDDSKAWPVAKGNPDYATAFKINSEADQLVVKVTGVQWEISRHNYWRGKILIEPTRIGGVTVSKASAKSAKTIWNNKIGKGATILVQRAGDVIPDFVKVVKPAKVAQMPPDGEWQWDKTKTNVIALEKDTDSALANHLSYSIKMLDVPNIGISVCWQLVESGYTDIVKLSKAKSADLIELLGNSRGAGLYTDLKRCIAEADVEQLMAASGAFGFGLGYDLFAKLLTVYPDLATLTKQQVGTLQSPAGYGPKRWASIASGMPLFQKFLKSIGRTNNIRAIRKVASSSKLKGVNVVFTGGRDTNLEEIVKDNGGTVSSSVKAGTILVVKSLTSTSSKMKAAAKFGIKPMTFEQFSTWLSKKVKMKATASVDNILIIEAD